MYRFLRSGTYSDIFVMYLYNIYCVYKPAIFWRYLKLNIIRVFMRERTSDSKMCYLLDTLKKYFLEYSKIFSLHVKYNYR